jgi:hypothetical protein
MLTYSVNIWSRDGWLPVGTFGSLDEAIACAKDPLTEQQERDYYDGMITITVEGWDDEH